MSFIIKHKKELLIGLITGILVMCITPVLNFIGVQLVKTFLILSEKFSHSYYSRIALNYEGYFTERNNFVINILFIILLLVGYSYIKITKDKITRDINSMIFKLEYIKKKKQSEEISEKEVDLKSKELENTIYALKEDASKNKGPIAMFVMCFILGIIVFSDYAIQKSVIKENLEFRNDLLKISPYVNDSTIHRLKSDWAQIQMSTDFDLIKIQADSIKTQLCIK